MGDGVLDTDMVIELEGTLHSVMVLVYSYYSIIYHTILRTLHYILDFYPAPPV